MKACGEQENKLYTKIKNKDNNSNNKWIQIKSSQINLIICVINTNIHIN